MHYIKSLSEYSDDKKSAVTFGKFDGLHLGHQKLINKVRELGKVNEISSVVCTFDMSSFWKERNMQKKMLMTGQERYAHLDGKVDCLVECPFTQRFRSMPAEEFIKDIICGKFHAEYVVVGTDFKFGYNQGGDIHTLKKYSGQYGYELIVIEKERYQDRIISSTYIKETLSEGNVELANRLLGYPYEVNGFVGHGRKLGRNLGFPTLNIAWPEDKFIPPRGVYISEILLGGMRYHGISNVGVRPTVTEKEEVVLETFLFDYAGDAYEKEVKIELIEFRRPERKFNSVEELKAQVDQDIAYGKSCFGIG